jgi:hypothetical protein
VDRREDPMTVVEDASFSLNYVDVSDLTNEFLLCRALGHSWDDNPGVEIPKTPLSTASAGILALRCIRCHTERWDFLNVSMEVFSRRYVYPATYRRLTAEQRGRPALRAEMLGRSLLIRNVQTDGRRRRRSS